jgi:hypothetical protein
MIWAERRGDEVYVFHNGKLLMKRWLKPGTDEKRLASALFNDGWPVERIGE